MVNDPRLQLAYDMVSNLPKFGRWANNIRDFETPYGKIGFRQAAVLYTLRHGLHESSDVTPSLVASHFNLQRSVVTRVLAKLEAGGFISRTEDIRDGRQAHIHITEKGTNVSEFVEVHFHGEMLAAIAFLEDDQVIELQRNLDLLAQVITNLEANRKGSRPQAPQDRT